MKFVFVEHAMNNVWDNGLLIIWDVAVKKKGRCFSCIGKCPKSAGKKDQKVDHGGDEYYLRVRNEIKPEWQIISFAPDCFKPNVVQDTLSKTISYIGEIISSFYVYDHDIII